LGVGEDEGVVDQRRGADMTMATTKTDGRGQR
jgi:hypothetical protein